MPYLIQCNEWRLLQALRQLIDRRKSRFNLSAPESQDGPQSLAAKQFDVEVRGLFRPTDCSRALSTIEFGECERKLKGVCQLLDGIVHPRVPQLDGCSRLGSLAQFLQDSDEDQTVDLTSGSWPTLFKPPDNPAWLKTSLALVADCNDSLAQLLAVPVREARVYPASETRRKTWKDVRLRRQATSALGAVFEHLGCRAGHEVMLNVPEDADDNAAVSILDLKLSSCPGSTRRPGARWWLDVRTGSLDRGVHASVEQIQNICLDLETRASQGEALVLLIEQYGLFGAWAPLQPSQPFSAPPDESLDRLISRGVFKPLDLVVLSQECPSVRYKLREKRALAVRLGYCLMDFFDADLSSRRLYYFPGPTKAPSSWKSHDTLHLSFVSSPPATADSYDFQVGHPTLLSFAKLLLEIDFGQSLDFRITSDDCKTNRGTWADLCHMVDRIEKERNDSYLEAVQGCLMVHKRISKALRLAGLDGKDAELAIRKELYGEVVERLETALAESTPRVGNKRQRSESPEPVSRTKFPFGTKDEKRHADPPSRQHRMPQETRSTRLSPVGVSSGVPGPRFTGMFDDLTPDTYPNDICGYADGFIQDHRDLHDEVLKEGTTTTRIKVAILDTGVDLTHPTIKEVCRGRIQAVKSWLPGRTTDVRDASGHGTHVTALLLDIASECDVYIAQIADTDSRLVSPHQIAEAVRHAVTEWQVDIITMSFGFQDEKEPGCSELGDAIRSAHASKVLLFAAASNTGAHAARPAFPARMSEVFCIYSGDGMGNCARTCPTARSNHYNFLTLGEAVESAWPRDLCKSPWMKRKSGTSFATPIAAGIAAFLLMVAYQTLPEERARKFKEHDKMRDLLSHVSHPRGGYHVLSIKGFFELPKEERKMILENLVDGRR